MILEIKKLCKSFSEKVIFENFNYAFPDTGLVMIEGDSGAGKTTLLRIISGLDKKYDGQVTGGGVENVSFSFQEYRLFPQLTALENITEISFKDADEIAVESAKDLLLRLKYSEEDMQLYPAELSGGMKQRVSFARAVLRSAPILILDEPTKELDPELCRIVADIIYAESKKRLVLLVTHQKEDFEKYEYTSIKL